MALQIKLHKSWFNFPCGSLDLNISSPAAMISWAFLRTGKLPKVLLAGFPLSLFLKEQDLVRTGLDSAEMNYYFRGANIPKTVPWVEPKGIGGVGPPL